MKKQHRIFFNVRIITFVLLIVGSMLLTACNPKSSEQKNNDLPETVKMAVLKGPTGMSVAHWKNAQAETPSETWPSLEVEVLASPDLIVPLIAKEEADLFMLPSSLAANVFKKTEGDLTCLAITNIGNLHLVERQDTINNLEDLKGKTIVLAGKGTNPELVLRNLLEKNSPELAQDVKLEFVPEHAAVVQKMAEDDSIVGLLPEPFLSVVEEQFLDLKIAVNLSDIWQKEYGEALSLGVLVAKPKWVEAHAKEIPNLLKALKGSVEKTLDNPGEAAKLIDGLGIVKEDLAVKAIPRAGMVMIQGTEMKNALETFFKNMGEEYATLVNDSLYYLGEE